MRINPELEVFNGLGQQIKDVKPENLDRFFGVSLSSAKCVSPRAKVL
jgi:hypothetical protein